GYVERDERGRATHDVGPPPVRPLAHGDVGADAVGRHGKPGLGADLPDQNPAGAAAAALVPAIEWIGAAAAAQVALDARRHLVHDAPVPLRLLPVQFPTTPKAIVG